MAGMIDSIYNRIHPVLPSIHMFLCVSETNSFIIFRRKIQILAISMIVIPQAFVSSWQGFLAIFIFLLGDILKNSIFILILFFYILFFFFYFSFFISFLFFSPFLK